MDIDFEAGQETIPLNTLQRKETASQSLTTDAHPRIKTAAERVAEAFSSLNPPVTTPLPSNSEIIKELVLGLKRQYDKQYYWMMLLAFVFIVVGIICFIILGYASYNSTINAICITFGLTLVLGSLILFVFALVIRCSYSRQPEKVARGPIRYVIRIEGDQWKRFITYFYSASGRPSGVYGWWFCCKGCGQHYQRLLLRNYGHVVFSSLGFMVDELYCITYDEYVVLNVELLQMIEGTNEDSNEPIVDMVMRVWLRPRVENRNGRRPPPFKIDIFLASELPSYVIPGIVNCVAIR
jgi:hypothetical protein